jgi:hypothetical protein
LGSSSILLERTRESKRGRAEEKRQHLLKESTHPKAKNMDFEAADNKEEQAVPYGFVEVVQHLLCTEIEEDISCNF